MSKVTYNQRGYIGSSMSVRAHEAYEDGEMPQSKWTKAAILDAIQRFCEEDDLVYDPSIEKMRKADLWDAFIEWKSWHHTSKYANVTDFYGLNEEACEERFERMTDRQLAEREAQRKAEREGEERAKQERAKLEKALEEQKQKVIAERKAALGPAYEYIARRNSAFTPDRKIVWTVAADEALHPEAYETRIAKSGRVMLRRCTRHIEIPLDQAFTQEAF